jgi:putative FmdB family regulatory protein
VKCGNIFEVFQRITARPEAACPSCGADAKRLIGTGGGIIFKGSGFYETDYKRKKKDTGRNVCPAKKDDKCSGCSLNDGGKDAKA